MKKSFATITLFFLAFSLLAQTKEERLNELLAGYQSINMFSGSALIYHKGKIILNQGYGFKSLDTKERNYSNTLFQIGSITKQFTATIILKLEEQGKLRVTDKLYKYFPGYPKGDSITIHHLLSHTSGIYNYTSDETFMKEGITKPATQREMLSLFEFKPLDFYPGSQMKYSNSGFLLLGYIIEKVTKRPYEEIVHEYILRPLQMSQSGFDFAHLKNKATGYITITDESGIKARLVDSSVSFAAGGMYSTTGDLLKWHTGLMNNKILRRNAVEKAFTAYKNNFGYGWVVDSLYGRKAIFHNGSIVGFTSNIYRVEQDNTCIILLNNVGNPKIDTITKDLLAVLYDKPYKVPEKKKEISLNRSAVKRYLGTYEFNPEFQMNIFTQNQKIYAQKKGDQDKFQIFPSGENLFFLKAFEAELEFPVNSNEEYDKLILHQGGKGMVAKKVFALPDQLYDTILTMDNVFTEAFNTRDLEKLRSLFSSDLDFFHDLTGYTDYDQHVKIFQENFKHDKKMRRELVKETLEVYPINNYGAIEVGIHNFYVSNNGQPETPDSSFKFMYIWQKKDGIWKITRTMSYAY